MQTDGRDEAKRVQRRADHRCVEGAGSLDGDCECVPWQRYQLGDVLQVEVELWRAGSVGCPAATPAGAGERATEEAAGEVPGRA